ncbi:MAG: lipoyl(octanoyl) transferase LipB [Rickettsiaceae bacterium]|nr:lipoyl(octanoyl) transferase LipB [Rickettsiaceae bacterium]
MTEWMLLEGQTDYDDALSLMEDIVQKIITQDSNDVVILAEHSDVITVGTGFLEQDIPKGLHIKKTGRGGKITFHGKGQRLIYPIFDLKRSPWNRDIKKYISFLHDWIIETLKIFGISSYKKHDFIGIWTSKEDQELKIASIGIRVRKWITYHGIGLNITTDLSKFDQFIPCGIKDVKMSSLKDLGFSVNFSEFDESLRDSFNKIKKIYQCQ